ncbi:MAG: cell wall metabolism sensor histidine kinase WalK [Firmicutes bacterium]|nr:cell wall metabolism sensor histidine kinase WalK [Bacillota bacterium]
MFKSIRWKFVIIYFLLVFIAMILAGVMIIKTFESYNLRDINNKIDDLSNLIMPSLEKIENFEENKERIDGILDNHRNIGFQEEIFIVDKNSNNIVATTSENINIQSEEVLDFNLIVKGFGGETAESNIIIDSGDYVIKTKDKVYPVLYDGENKGIIYIRYNLNELYDNLNNYKKIIVQATILSLITTVVLGSVIAKSIVNPINDVTDKAAKMADGDFDVQVDIKSDDEIGKLGEMFNHLTGELRKSYSDISREKSKMEAIVNYMADGLIAVNNMGEIILVNPKAMDMLGIDEGEFDIHKYNEVISKYSERLLINNIIENNPNWIGSETIAKDDSIYRVNFAPYQNDVGMKKGLVLVMQDVTEQQKLDDMRREFVANVSHELKTPLTSIKSYTETILDGAIEDTDMTKNFLSVVLSEADRMNRLVKDLLQLSNFDSKKIMMHMEYQDIVDLLKKSIMKMDVTAKQMDHKVTLTTTYQSLIAYFDWDRIEQVVLNIIGNAIKYTPRGGKVEVYLMTDDSSVLIKVIDNGDGIHEDALDRLFERFYRVDKARSRDLGGTGLGLSIAKEIVELHEGEIEIDSIVGEGTVVTIRLPLEDYEEV